MIELYVGTTEDRAARAADRGLRREFSATRDPQMATELARWKAEERSRPGVVLAVRVDERDLRPDWEMYTAPVRPVLDRWGIPDADAWREGIEAGEVPIPRGDDDWETSLEVTDWVLHIGTVGPENIAVAWRA